MFNQGNNGLDLINHAIRMGTVGQVLRRNDLIRQLSNANPTFVAVPPTQPAQQSAAAPTAAPPLESLSRAAATRQGSDRIIPNAFQFPWKLHDMLDSASADGFSSVVSWHSDGRSFRVHRIQDFVDSVMPTYFKQTKYKSFQRQLNLYGFSRINEGPTKGGYKHQHFIRGQRHLCQLITRNSTGEAQATTRDLHGTSTNSTPSHTFARGGRLPASSPAAISIHESSSNQLHPLIQDVHENRNVTEPVVTSTGSAGSIGSSTVAYHVDTADAAASAYSDPNTNQHEGIVATRHKSSSSGASSADEKNDESKANKEFQFPWKLYEMLEKSESDSFEHIVSWQPDFASFKVHDPNKFVDIVMPRFFKQTKYKSFQRQLNLYGFTRVDDGPSKGSYMHQCFVRGQKDLLSNLSRQKMRNDKLGVVRQTTYETSHENVSDMAVAVATRYRDSASFRGDVLAALAAIKGGERVTNATIKSAGKNPMNSSVPSQQVDAGLTWRRPQSESPSDYAIKVVILNEPNIKKTYNVHRDILATGPRRSQYLAKQQKNPSFTSNCVLHLGPEEASVFPLLLDHMYSDMELHLNAEKAYTLYAVADRLGVLSMLQLVTEFYCKMMNRENIVDFVTLARNFKNKTLLDACISKCAEELRSLDHTSTSKLDPGLLLQVVIKSKTLPRNYKCGSNRLSLFVAECVQAHPRTLTLTLFYSLTDKEHLPHIEPIAAIKILACETSLLAGITASSNSEALSLHERCVDSIARNWQKLRADVEESPVLSSHMKSIGSGLLFEILLKATEATKVSV